MEQGSQTPMAQGPGLNHLDDQVDSDQEIVNTELSLCTGMAQIQEYLAHKKHPPP